MIAAILLLIHGLFHLIGVARVFRPAIVKYNDPAIGKTNGLFWLAVTAILLSAAGLSFVGNQYWWMPALVGITFSQTLVFLSWKSAKAGTIINIAILLFVVNAAAELHFKTRFTNDATALFVTPHETALLTEQDIAHLPLPVQKYLCYSGCIGKPRVENFRITFSGQLRKNTASEWMPFTSEQYNFVDSSARLFYMKAVMKHLPVSGYHRYKNGNAFMDIRLFSLFTVEYQTGKEMGIAETVTFFNDMCCMAPATLIDPRITWDSTQGNTVHTRFTTGENTISAWLYFNDAGELINFISEDRYAVQDDGSMKKVRWSSPLSNYKTYNGYRLASQASTIYHYPDGDLCYGNFTLANVQYNLSACP